MILAGAALPFPEVELEVRVAARDRGDALRCCGSQRRTAEIGVRSIPVAFSTRRNAGRCAAASRSRRRSAQVARVAARADLEPRVGEHLTRRVDRERVAACFRELVDRWEIAKLHARHDSPPAAAASLSV